MSKWIWSKSSGLVYIGWGIFIHSVWDTMMAYHIHFVNLCVWC